MVSLPIVGVAAQRRQGERKLCCDTVLGVSTRLAV